MASILKSTQNTKAMVCRIQQMEQYFDAVLQAKDNYSPKVINDMDFQRMVQELSEYMKSGMWLHDYECDERGELPADLKRGVLSEDGLYHLLEQIDTLKKAIPVNYSGIVPRTKKEEK